MSKKEGPSFEALLALLGEFFRSRPDLASERFVVAYSGGLDSSCLLAALVSSGRMPTRVLYVDHGLRAESELLRERAKVRAFCAERGLGLTVAGVRPGAISELAAKRGEGTESAAREFRYRALSVQAKRWGASLILTAHHQDDVLETLLFRALRASGPAGLGGIAAVRELPDGLRLVRPLLAVSRAQLEACAEELGLAYSTDSSNAGDDFARNKIRHLLVPVLDSGFPGWRKGLLGTAAAARAETEAMGAALGALVRALGNGHARTDARLFAAAPTALRAKILGALLESSGSRARFSRASLAAAAAELAAGAGEVERYDRRFFFSIRGLECAPRLDFGPDRGYFFLIPSEGNFAAGGLEVRAWWAEEKGIGPGKPTPGPGLAGQGGWLAEGSFSFPLVLRTRRPGDSFRNVGGPAKLDEALKAMGLDPRMRRLVPVVEDREGIAAILPEACDGWSSGKDRHRSYAGPLDGRRFFIRIKGV